MTGRSQPVGIVVVGAGRAGMVHARNFRSGVGPARLAGIIDADAEAAERARRELELEGGHGRLAEALDDASVRAVVITTPTFTHEELAVASARAGKHVLCEKPMALDLPSAERMIRAAEDAGVTLQLGFMRRFDPTFLDAGQKLAQGEIGEVMTIRSLTRGPGLPPDWACDPERGGGMLAEVNSHDFDTVRWLSGSEYRRIYAEAAVHKAFELAGRWQGFYDTAVVNARMQNDVLALIDGSCPVDYGYDARVELLGTKGTLFIGEMARGAVTVCTRERGVTQQNFPSWRDRFREAYLAEARHFTECIVEGRPPAVTGADGREALRAVLAASDSLRSNAPVALTREVESR